MVPERWMVLTVRVPAADVEDDLAEALLALGGAAVEEEVDLLTTYLLPPEDPDAFAREAYDILCAAAGVAKLDVIWRWQADEDWARSWRRGLQPRRVGERLIVAPSWTRPEPGPDDVVVVIDPEMAFGTGEHATTRLTLALLERALRPGDRVLDVGTGSGILAIAAAHLGAGEVVAVESDPDAEENARQNLVRNGVAHRVHFERGVVDAAYLAGAGRWDGIVANVLSGVLRPLLPALRDALRPDGRLILCGILEEESAGMLESAAGAGLVPEAELAEEGWWAVLLTAGAAARGAAPS
jgi:ribosomal protein L11 methyltransferase